MLPTIILYFFCLLIFLYLHSCLQSLDAISLYLKRQNRWYEIMPLEPEPTRLETFSMYVRAIYRVFTGEEAPHQGGEHFDLGPVHMYGGYPRADDAGDPLVPVWQEDMEFDDAVQMPDLANAVKPQKGGRMQAWRRPFDGLRRRCTYGRR